MDSTEHNHFYNALDELKLVDRIRSQHDMNDFMFDGVNIAGKRVLDIGGGIGMQSCYAAVLGAREVVCLEPEIDGGYNGMVDRFNMLKNALGIDSVQLVQKTFQEYEPEGTFDVVMSHASINHLDESACANLHRNPVSYQTYMDIFEKIADLCSHNGQMVISDCSSKNFFQFIGRKHPINTSIEWDIHQPPEIWGKMLVDSGFTDLEIRWGSYSKAGRFGKIFLRNKVGAYFCASKFRILMHRATTID